MDDDKEVVVIRCSRCEDLPVPGVISSRVPCDTCGRDVWVAASTFQTLHTHYPDHPLKITCSVCNEPGLVEMPILPEQIETLRSFGDSDDVIAYKLAMASVAGGTASLEEAEGEILAFPHGERAKAFSAAFRRVRLTMAALQIPRN